MTEPRPARAPPPEVPSETGRKSWALGFLAYIPIPLISAVVAGIVMAAVYPGTKRRAVPLATENARNAANWGLTLASVTLLSYLYALGTVLLLTNPPFGLVAVGFLVYLALMVVHLVVSYRGTVASGQGRVYRTVCAIRFLKP